MRARSYQHFCRHLQSSYKQQEQVHIDTLTQVLTSNGVTPVPPCSYKFPDTDPRSFVSLANMITT